MRNVTLLLAVLCLAMNALAADPRVVQKVRDELVAQGRQSKVEEPLKDWYLKLISDDAQPLDEQEVFRSFTGKPADRTVAIKRSGLLQVVLFRWRDRPAALLRLCDSFTPSERSLLAGLLVTVYKPLVTADYAALFGRLFSDFAVDAQNPSQPPEWRTNSLELARACVAEGMACNRKAAAEHVGRVLGERIVDPQVRRNIVLEAIARGGRDALPIAQWYFETYCHQPQESKILLAYLKLNMIEDEWKALVKTRQDQLRETIDVLSGKSTVSTSVPAATQPAPQRK